MKILIATAVSGAWPYIQEMVAELQGRGDDVVLFDIDDLGRAPILVRLAFRFPQLQSWATCAALKARLARLRGQFDVVNIHYASPIYADLAPALKRCGKALITTIWGSDFLRADAEALAALGKTFDASDMVTSNNPEVARKICEWRPITERQIRIVRFGMASLDVIAGLMDRETRGEARKALDVPADRVVAACGYNANPQQNHLTMAEAFGKLAPDIRARLFALVPMTYPDNPVYVAEVRRAFERADVAFRIVEGMQDTETNCRMRIASDYALNIQITDSLSASIQEHMFAGSGMIVGEWLPYGNFEDLGVPLRRVTGVDDIAAALREAAVIAPDLASGRPAHAAAIYDYSSWSSNIGKWRALYAAAVEGAA